MPTGPFDTGLVTARLVSAPATPLKIVQGSADLATVLQAGGAPQTPAAYVLLAIERSDGAYGTSEAHVQTVVVTINVVLAVRNYRAAELGTQVKDDLNSVIAFVRGRLLGWPPGSDFAGLSFAGGVMENYTNSTVWWNEGYRTSYFTRVLPQ